MPLKRSPARSGLSQLLFPATLCLAMAQPCAVRAQAPFMPSQAPVAPLGGGRVTGQVTGIIGTTLQLMLRNGRTIAINLRTAKAHDLVPRIYAGEFLQVQGSVGGQGTMTAASVMRAKSAPAAWPADIP